eukprot:5325093-Prymnesium_polylepis.1
MSGLLALPAPDIQFGPSSTRSRATEGSPNSALRMRPPTRSDASSTTKDEPPWPWSVAAAAMPAMPAPTITTSCSGEPESVDMTNLPVGRYHQPSYQLADGRC